MIYGYKLVKNSDKHILVLKMSKINVGFGSDGLILQTKLIFG